jgi:ElaB/YqjD/DUF883 family membrane-anchored ribosome-binding protein
MSLKEDLDRTGRDVKDTAKEAKHRATAAVEHTKRDVLGDDMPVGEKARSIVNEMKNRAQADIDKTP